MATGNGSTAPVHTGGRVLPTGAGGMLLVGKLRFAAVSSRSAKQFVCDVESVGVDGRAAITSATAWLTDQNNEPTPFGKLVMGGHVGGLVGSDVVLAVEPRAKLDKLYLGIEGIWPLGAESAPRQSASA